MAAPRFVWSEKRPTRTGWYWFQVGYDSPKTMAPDFESIVFVGCDENENIYGVKIGQIAYPVKEMGGRFAGPIPSPIDD